MTINLSDEMIATLLFATNYSMDTLERKQNQGYTTLAQNKINELQEAKELLTELQKRG